MDYGGSTSVSVVLVHGGFLGPWSWSDVVGLLEQQSISVYVPELPSMGSASGTMPFGDFYADAAAVRGVLDGLRAPVLVCGHSYGGAVITEAAGGPHPAVAHLVYLTAAVPDINQSMASLAPATDTDTEASAAADEAVSEGPVPGPSGSIILESDQAVAALFHDCSEARARQAAGLLRPMNPAVGAQTLTRAAWRDVPSTFVRGDQDRMPELVANAFFDRSMCLSLRGCAVEGGEAEGVDTLHRGRRVRSVCAGRGPRRTAGACRGLP